MSYEQLKPCPFCGGEAEYIQEFIDNGGYYPHDELFVSCQKCDALMMHDGTGNQWNTRTPPEAKWISVEDRLPEESGIYLTVSIVGSMDAKIVVNTLRGQAMEHHPFRWNTMDWQRVTHWMPLPPPPAQKDGE